MTPFRYIRPSDAAAAVQAGRGAGARFIAGGTCLVDLLRLNVERPAQVVDLNGLDLGGVDVAPDGALRVGALVRNTDLAYHPAVVRDFRVLSQALLSGASPQLRNMATLGGNLLQRTRCAYFRDAAVPQCNKRAPGSGCAAIDGVSRMHAILGGSAHCIAVHPSDMCVALVALDATVHVRGAGGERDVRAADFHLVPADHPDVETVVAPGEIVTGVTLPKTAMAARSAYVKVRDRASFAFALASAAVALDLDGRTIRGARVVLGGVATKPWRAIAVERALAGQPATGAAFEKAAAAAVDGAEPRPDNAFKVELARRVVVRALEQARDAS